LFIQTVRSRDLRKLSRLLNKQGGKRLKINISDKLVAVISTVAGLAGKLLAVDERETTVRNLLDLQPPGTRYRFTGEPKRPQEPAKTSEPGASLGIGIGVSASRVKKILEYLGRPAMKSDDDTAVFNVADHERQAILDELAGMGVKITQPKNVVI
jgi:hypothetical protein